MSAFTRLEMEYFGLVNLPISLVDIPIITAQTKLGKQNKRFILLKHIVVMISTLSHQR